ncbi:MAG: SMR family transporter [Nanoarchaeota archaeon]
MLSATMLKTLFFSLICIAVLLEVFADILFKRWSVENKSLLFAAGLLIYSLGTVFWAFSLKYEFLSKAVSIFTIMNMILVVLAGVILFKENLSLLNKIGMGLGVASIILIEL